MQAGLDVTAHLAHAAVFSGVWQLSPGQSPAEQEQAVRAWLTENADRARHIHQRQLSS